MRWSKSYNDYKKARDKAWEIIFKNNIHRLPVEVQPLCDAMGIFLYSYAAGSELIKDYKLSEHTKNDGFATGINRHDVIFYNPAITPHGRKRFTVAHEIGHIVLGHLKDGCAACRNGATVWNADGPEPSPEETAANVFASRLLAPACVLHALDIHTAPEIQQLCGLSYTAAQVRAERMAELYERERDWMKTKGYSCFGVSPRERRALEQFAEFIRNKK